MARTKRKNSNMSGPTNYKEAEDNCCTSIEADGAPLDSGFASYKSSLPESVAVSDMEASPISEISAQLREVRISNIEEKGNVFVSQDELAEMLYQDDDGDTQLHIAIIQNVVPVAMYMINCIYKLYPDWLNTPNTLLQTPLHLAVIVRSPKIVEHLIRSDADIHFRDSNGNTPLHVACFYGYDEIVEIFLKLSQFKQDYQGCTLNERNYEGQTCLHLASERTHLPIIKLLTKYGADVNVRDGKSGKTILHYAAEMGNTILLTYILQIKGLDLNANTYAGYTPLSLARGRGYRDIVQTLIKYGAEMEFTQESNFYEINDT